MENYTGVVADDKQENEVVEAETTSNLQEIDKHFDGKLDNILSTQVSDSIFNNQRVFKKSLPNNKLTLYLINRDLVVHDGKVDKLLGVFLVDPEYVKNKKVYGQVTLTFRYGREDEEVMGLKFCTEAIVCLVQLYPSYPGADHQVPITALQEALVRRLGPTAHAFSMEVPAVAPPSVHLLPAKEYNGAPIGTSYDVKAYVAERADEKLHRNTTIRMGIRVIQGKNPKHVSTSNLYSISPKLQFDCKTQSARIMENDNEIVECDEQSAPHAAVEKPFLLSGGSIRLKASLDRGIYDHGDSISVHVNVTNDSHKSVKRIQVLVLQHVDVCMFNSGKFKNVVAVECEKDRCPLGPGSSLTKTYTVSPTMSSTKNWIALEDNYTKTGTTLASTVVCSGTNDKDRDPFAINVSYYVKVKLLISMMGGVMSIKLPFTLMHCDTEPDLIGFPSPIREQLPKTSIVNNIVCEQDKSHLTVVETIGFDGKLRSELTRVNQTVDIDLIEKNDSDDST
ncbi:hypothetical protein PV328_005567 [Microctonus aethiopoides]|nr:hypothetical protein PV328_005567 [Microctonus aethiopoides]